MSIVGLFTGHSTLLVGVEDDPDGGVRCYLGRRSRGLYCVVDEPEMVREVRAAWGAGGHVVVPVPPAECVYADEGVAGRGS